MREAFKPAEEYLSTQPIPSSIEEQRKRDFSKNAEVSGWIDKERLDLVPSLDELNAQDLRNEIIRQRNNGKRPAGIY